MFRSVLDWLQLRKEWEEFYIHYASYMGAMNNEPQNPGSIDNGIMKTEPELMMMRPPIQLEQQYCAYKFLFTPCDLV